MRRIGRSHHHRFNVRFSTLVRVGRFPKMPPLHKARSCASSCFSINFMSFATHSFQVFLSLPLPLFPSTSIFLHSDTQSSVSLRFTCPNHLNLPWRTLSDTLTIPSLSRSSSLEFLSFSVTPHIHLIIILSALPNLCMSSAFIALVSHALYSF